MTKPKIRIIDEEVNAFDFLVSAYSYGHTDKEATYDAYVEVRNGKDTITIDVNDMPAFVEALTKAAAQARTKGEAMAVKHAKKLQEWNKRQQAKAEVQN